MRIARVMIVGALAVLVGSGARAAGKAEDAAQASAAPWLKLVDQGKYDASWEQAAELFKKSVTRDQWRQAAAAAREPLGTLTSRKVKSREYKEQIPGAPDGKYVILQYDSVFEKKASAIETVVAMVDPDGAWRTSGYFIR
jgi:hypothetical protein